MEAQAIITQLGLKPHPEGGWYREVYRSTTHVVTSRGSRSALTTIYYLLEHTQVSRWHVVDADEIWHFYAGDALELLGYDPQSCTLTRHVLGSPSTGSEAVGVIAAGIWQAARSLGSFSLVGCSVGPGFEFEGFEFVADLPEHLGHFTGTLEPFASLL